MATTSARHQTWQFFAFVSVFFAVWTLRATIGFSIDESIDGSIARAAYSTTLKCVLWVLPAASFAYWARNQSPPRYLGLSAIPSMQHWLGSLLITGVFLLVVAIYEIGLGSKFISIAPLAAQPLVLSLLQLAVSPLLEELLFRGLVLHELQTIAPRLIANVLTSLLFAAVHLPFWLAHGGLSMAVAANVFGLFLFSLLAGWLYAQTSSVWPSTVAHSANNLLVMVLQTS